jgi:hypothetical protein
VTNSSLMQLTPEARIREIIRDAIAGDQPPQSETAMAELVFESEPETAMAWAKLKLAVFARTLMAPPKREPNLLQQFLPGFEALPARQRLTLDKRLPLKNGKRLALGQMTVKHLHESIDALRKRHASKLDPTLDWLQDLANQMSPYSQKHYKPGEPVTVTRYLEMKRDKVPVPSVRTSEDRSAAASKTWAKRSKAQRSAIASKRSQNRPRE